MPGNTTPAVPATPPVALPALRPGDRLTQPEFHRRYEQVTGDTKFELVEGVVYMASPTRQRHGNRHSGIAGVAFVYSASTPGVESGIEPTILLSDHSEPEPDACLYLLPDVGGRMAVNAEGYLSGEPDWLAEIGDSTEALDLGQKRRDYARCGVREYVVLCLQEQRLRAFDLANDRELPLEGGVYRSRIFPGLWIEERAALAGDSARLLAVVQQGIASPEHAAFVAQLQERKRLCE